MASRRHGVLQEQWLALSERWFGFFGRHNDVLFLFFIRSLLGMMPSSARLGIHLIVTIKNLQLANMVLIAQVTCEELLRDTLYIEPCA